MEKFGVSGVATWPDTWYPEKTWDHYESGVIIPASVLLEFMELTGVTHTGS